MKIIQTPARFYPYIGGTEKVCFYLSRGLVKKGYSVKVICANEPPVGDAIVDGIQVRRLPYIGKIANTNITPSLLSELSKEQFDIIHTHLPHPWSADISAIAAHFKNKPLFLSYYNDITGSGINKFIADIYNLTALKFLLKRADRIIINHENYLKTSPFLKSFANKIIIAPLGVDSEKFKPQDVAKDNNEKIIFFLSVLDKFHLYKGLDYLLLAIKNFKNRFPLKLYIGGSGELLGYYQKFVDENGLSRNVQFLGFLEEEKLLKYYNLCDVFVLPSISSAQEGFGLVALEAMACKKPVIVTDIVGAAQDIKRENAGIVVKSKSIDELTNALEVVLLNPEKSKQMGENAFNLARKSYSWENYVNVIENEYLQTIA